MVHLCICAFYCDEHFFLFVALGVYFRPAKSELASFEGRLYREANMSFRYAHGTFSYRGGGRRPGNSMACFLGTLVLRTLVVKDQRAYSVSITALPAAYVLVEYFHSGAVSWKIGQVYHRVFKLLGKLRSFDIACTCFASSAQFLPCSLLTYVRGCRYVEYLNLVMIIICATCGVALARLKRVHHVDFS